MMNIIQTGNWVCSGSALFVLLYKIRCFKPLFKLDKWTYLYGFFGALIGLSWSKMEPEERKASIFSLLYEYMRCYPNQTHSSLTSYHNTQKIIINDKMMTVQ